MKGWIGIFVLVAGVVMSCVSADAATKSNGIVSVTIPDTWQFGDDRYYIDFHRSDSPTRILGLVNAYIADGGTAREVAEYRCNSAREDGNNCDTIQDAFIGPHAPAVYVYVFEKDGLTTLSYFAVISGTDTMIELGITAPQGLFSERPGFLNDVDFIKDNLRF